MTSEHSAPSRMPEKPSLDGIETKWAQVWNDQNTYVFDRTKARDEVYSIDTPPPTVSGSLHVGHVFSYTHTDCIARYQRMQGKAVFYPMGWDDNGLPTERRVQNYFGVRCDPSLHYDADFVPPEKPGKVITGRVTGAQTGAVLAFISSGILGQYDPFTSNDGEDGCLLLVYPNVIAVERQLRVSPADFRLWVCLHEVTHRVQFTANPWLAGHMSDALAALISDAGTGTTGEMIARLAEFARSRGGNNPNDAGILGLVRAVQSPPQREALDRLIVLGTLLEGHADFVMDGVGPAVVPSVATIRARFDQRRSRRQPPLQRLLRALFGVNAKLSQYTRGKAFVDHVVGRVGMERFNTVWSGPDTLPLPDEIENPQRWIDRVL